jgi:peptide/nickel transport system permease protein
MGFYLIKRLLLMIPLFIGITIISFGVIHLAPGSPIDMATDLNPKATAEVKERMRAFYGLDNPCMFNTGTGCAGWSPWISASLFLKTGER